MSPPLRSAAHRSALQAALAGGVLQLVGTDHAAFNSTQKAMGSKDFRLIPNGVNGIEERMHVTWQEMVVSGREGYTGCCGVSGWGGEKQLYVDHIYTMYAAILVLMCKHMYTSTCTQAHVHKHMYTSTYTTPLHHTTKPHPHLTQCSPCSPRSHVPQ